MHTRYKYFTVPLLFLLSFEATFAVNFPSTGPSGSFSGGMFGTYFQNISSNPCPAGQMIYAFSTGAGNYGAPLCRGGASSSYWNSLDGGANVFFTGTAVGIGTISPGAKLEVAGQVKITGGGIGSGKVLTSDATGLASWQSLSGLIQAESDPIWLAQKSSYPSYVSMNGGRPYTASVDFNNLSTLYETVFINNSGTLNMPSGFAGMGYYFGMGAGDTSVRGFQLLGSNQNTSELYFREKSNGTWNRVLTNNNYTSFSPSLTGLGASGTWGINITGNATTANGTTGWSNPTYGGGWYMSDITWMRAVNDKSVWVGNGLLGAQGGLTIGYGGIGSPSAGAIIAGNVGIGTSTPRAKLEVNGNIIAAAPTASDHVATKAYVDAAVSGAGGGGQYMGVTSTSYNGNLGGPSGANAKCQVDYAGSHMCSLKEIKRLTTSPIVNGHYTFEAFYTATNGQVFGDSTAFSPDFDKYECYGWTIASDSWTTEINYAGITEVSGLCSTLYPIHCCK